MDSILVKLLLISALAQLGLNSLFDQGCRGFLCLKTVHAASLKVTKIDWRPISVFPEEAKRFQEKTLKRSKYRVRNVNGALNDQI